MAITVKHKFVSAIPDAGDPTIVQPSNWNDSHDLTGTVPVANGGTGASTATDGLNNLLPSQTGNNGKVLATDGTNATWTTNGSGDVVGPASATDNAIARFDSTTGKLIQNSGVTIDDNSNINANALDDGYLNTAASGTLITLTSASVRRYTITGSGGQTIKLPDATTLANGAVFQFDNNQSSGAITVNNNSNTLVVSVPSGGFVLVNLLSNATAAGSWDRHDQAPSNVSWSTNTFDYAGSITSATWNGNTVAVNRGGTGVTTSTGSGSVVLNTSPTLTTPAITGGTIDNTVIGGTTPAAGTFTTITGQTERLNGTGTNLATFTTTLNNANYGQNGLTLTAGQTDPFSGTTAALLNDGTTTGLHYVLVGNLVGGTQTFSCYAKAGTSNYLGLYFAGTGSGVFFNLTTGAFSAYVNSSTNISNYTSTNAGGGWWRLSVTISGSANYFWMIMSENGTSYSFTGTSQTVYVAAPQIETASAPSTYIPNATGTAIYGSPALSFSGVSSVGLQNDGSLYVQPAGTGALQAQATTSTATGGNARGANAVDWQTTRTTAAQVASNQYSVIGGGNNNTSGGFATTISGGSSNTNTGSNAFIGGGTSNNSSGGNAGIVSGQLNAAAGQFNFIGGGFTNSGTASAAVTTQATTIAVSAGTTFYLSATNANIKVGQYITGTGVSANTYATSTVTTGTAAVMNTSTISGTTLTVGTLASGTIIAGMVLTGTGVTAGTYIVSGAGSSWTVSTSQTVSSTTITGTAYTFTISQNATTTAGITLSFYTPHGVVVGGGNNQATGSYSFIGGGGDAGTAANRNTASGDWSTVAGGQTNQSSASYSFIGGGQSNVSSGGYGFVGGGIGNQATTGNSNATVGGQNNTSSGARCFIGGGLGNLANSTVGSIVGGAYGTVRSINGMTAFGACNQPIAGSAGVSQGGLLVLGVATTDATATVLRSDTSAAGTTNQVILPNNSAYAFTATVISTANFALATTATAGSAGTATITFAAQTVAPFIVGQTIVVAGVTPAGYNGTYTVTACTTTTVQYANATTGAQTVAGTVTATSLTKAWKLEGCIMRTSAAAGTRLVGSVTSTVLATDTGTAAWTAVAAADTTNGGLKITFTGAAATTIRTVAQVQTTEVTY